MSKRREGPAWAKPFRRLVAPEHPALHQVAEAVEPGEDTYKLAVKLVLTAQRYRGLAVAAPQVGRAQRVIGLVDASRVANPRIVESKGQQIGEEGCLTFPGRWFRVERAAEVMVEGIDPRDGSAVHLRREGLEARLWQHEIDHLDGILIPELWPEIPKNELRSQR